MMFGGADAADLRLIVHRAFHHATMKKVAKGIVAANPPETWRPLLDKPSPQLKLIATTFVELQEERHQADYDPARRLTREEATDLVERVEAATKAWVSIRKSGPTSKAYSLEARAFLAALLVHDQVSRR